VLWRFSRDETGATAVIPTERIEELFLLRGRSDSGTDSEKVRAAGAIWVFPLDVASLLHCLDKHTAKTSLTLEMTVFSVLHNLFVFVGLTSFVKHSVAEEESP
jgi:hypothetical protein